MLLIISNKRDKHTDIVVEQLYRRSMKFFRWNLEDSLQKHALFISFGPQGWNGYLNAEGRHVDLARVQAVWYRRPGNVVAEDSITDDVDRQFAVREAQHMLRGVWHLLENVFWINDPVANQRMGSKPLQLRLASELGLATPRSLITNEPKEAARFCRDVGCAIAKPLSGGFVDRPGKAIHIYTNRVSPEHLAAIDNVRVAPTLFQE